MNRTLVISIDALISADIERLKTSQSGAYHEAGLLGRGYPVLLPHSYLSLPCNHFHRLLAGSPRYLQQ